MIESDMSARDVADQFDSDFSAVARDEYGSVVVLDVVADARFVIITDESQRNVRLYVHTMATDQSTRLYYFEDLFDAFGYVRPYMTRENLNNID